MNDWIDAEQRAERAQLLCEMRKWDEALSEMDAALRVNPHNAIWWAQRGFLLEQLERGPEAVEAYGKAHELDPPDRDLAMAFGVSLVGAGRHAEALRIISDVAQEHPQFEPAYCYRIMAYAELGEHDRAEEMFYLAQQLNQDCPHCFCHIGISLAARKSFERAIYCWKRALEIDPAYPQLQRRIAQAYRSSGDLKSAHRHYLTELRQVPGDVELLHELGDLALESGDYTAAMDKFRQVLELTPDHAHARFGLGTALLFADRCDEARQTLLPLELADSDYPHLSFRIAQCWLRQGKIAEARSPLEKALQAAPADPEILLTLGACLLYLGYWIAAAELFRRLIAVDADHAVAYSMLASCCYKCGDYELSLQHNTRAAELNPRFGPALHQAALTCIELGRWREAREWINRARKLDPDSQRLQKLSKRLWVYRLTNGFRKIFRRSRRG